MQHVVKSRLQFVSFGDFDVSEINEQLRVLTETELKCNGTYEIFKTTRLELMILKVIQRHLTDL